MRWRLPRFRVLRPATGLGVQISGLLDVTIKTGSGAGTGAGPLGGRLRDGVPEIAKPVGWGLWCFGKVRAQ